MLIFENLLNDFCKVIFGYSLSLRSLWLSPRRTIAFPYQSSL